MNRRLLVVVAVAGAAATAAAILLSLYAHDFDPAAAADNKPAVAAVDGIWIAAGLIAWRQRPQNRVGPLMVLFGFVDVGSLIYWDAAVPYVLAAIVSVFIIPVAVHVFVAF